MSIVAKWLHKLMLHDQLLDQISRMYDNPELKRVIRDARAGKWESAFYPKYRPEINRKLLEIPDEKP